jgi:hypothetical protein
VTEGGDHGVTVRRREQYFTFDHEVYRAWSNGALVWLDDDGDDGSDGSTFQQNGSRCCQQEIGRSEEGSVKDAQELDRDRSMYVPVQQNERTESMGEKAPDDSRGMYVFRTAVHDREKTANIAGNMDSGSKAATLIGSMCCHCAAIVLPALPPGNPADYIPLPVAKDEPEPASAAGEGTAAPGSARPPDV